MNTWREYYSDNLDAIALVAPPVLSALELAHQDQPAIVKPGSLAGAGHPAVALSVLEQTLVPQRASASQVETGAKAALSRSAQS